MKKLIIALFSSALIYSCSDEQYSDLNRDPNNPTTTRSEALFTSAIKSLSDQMTSTNVNTNVYRLFAQYWTETTYVDESNYDLVTRNIPANHWSELYRDVLFDLKDAKKVVESESQGTELESKKAMITVLEVYTWQQMVDTFGDIPYSEALMGSEKPSPKYDNAKEIYKDLFVRLDDAISKLGANGYASADVIYQGDMSKWRKFANSLKLRLAMRVSDVADMSALSKQKAQEAVTAGVFGSNADNANIQYEAATPNTNPLWVDLVQSGRSDFVASNTIVNIMNTLSDPRRSEYFDQNLGAGLYVGGPYGDNNSFSSYTHVGPKMHDPTFRGVLLDYSEVQFMLAQAAAMSYTVSGTAESYYNNGITASMQEWGVSASNISTYLSNPSVSYSTASGDWRQKIGKQFWLAMYNRGFEGWTVWRQFNSPTFNLPVVSGLPVPSRYTYPISEQNLNGTNYAAAATAIGGDLMTTKLFWDTL